LCVSRGGSQSGRHADELAKAEAAYEDDKNRAEEELRRLRDTLRRVKVDSGAAAQAQVQEVERAAEERAAAEQAQHEATVARLQAEHEAAVAAMQADHAAALTDALQQAALEGVERGREAAEAELCVHCLRPLCAVAGH
jgi:hypothetical protein